MDVEGVRYIGGVCEGQVSVGKDCMSGSMLVDSVCKC